MSRHTLIVLSHVILLSGMLFSCNLAGRKPRGQGPLLLLWWLESSPTGSTVYMRSEVLSNHTIITEQNGRFTTSSIPQNVFNRLTNSINDGTIPRENGTFIYRINLSDSMTLHPDGIEDIIRIVYGKL